jgi:hypothetical protein
VSVVLDRPADYVLKLLDPGSEVFRLVDGEEFVTHRLVLKASRGRGKPRGK